MKRWAQILVWTYAHLLNLYPRRYRADYGEELETVFSLVVNEAAQRGRFSVIRLGWRELRDLPGAVIREHRRERKKEMETETNVPITLDPAPWREVLAAITLFLLGALVCLLSWLRVSPPWLAIGFRLYPLFMLALGLIMGLRRWRWFLPYAGLVGYDLGWALIHRGTIMGLNTRAGWIGSLLNRTTDRLLSWIDLLLVRPGSPWIVRAVYGSGRFWLGLLGLTALAVLIIAAWRPLRPLYVRMRDDWTLLSFGLYGATLVAAFDTFEDYPSARWPYTIVMLLILATGALVYLRSTHPRQRALALFVAMALSMAVGAAGKAIIHASPLGHRPYRTFTWQTEALSAVFQWGWLGVIVLSPALLGLLPRPAKPLQAG
ncbi:MAG: hypothetical protein SXV54_17490 [Chloroflexota bacterium]|nr:hypothetical protein [Chloroflexota bacterium]